MGPEQREGDPLWPVRPTLALGRGRGDKVTPFPRSLPSEKAFRLGQETLFWEVDGARKEEELRPVR